MYRSNQAQKRYEERKEKSHYRKRIPNKRMRKYIVRKLKKTWSPELIAGRIAIDLPGFHVSHETIYQWIYSERKDLISYLVQQHKKRKKRGSLKQKRMPKVPNRTMIDERPKYIANRKTAGHWETDTAVSRQSKAAIMAAVERKSRYLMGRKLKSKSAACMNKALIKSLQTLPRQLLKSLTYDNGTENAFHEVTNAVLKTSSYFCNPYHSWEKGSIENRIGIIRRFFPKKTNWALISQASL
jgi:IS30 family transposase